MSVLIHSLIGSTLQGAIPYPMTIVIDNGTHTIKYGIKGQPPIVQQNIVYKHRDTFTFTPSKEGYVKKMFNHNIIVNYDVLEGTLDNVFSRLHVGDVREVIMTIGTCTPKTVRREVAEMMMEVYEIDKLQLGYDSVYSCMHNGSARACTLIVSSSHAETHLLRLDRLHDAMVLPYASERARAYYHALVRGRTARKDSVFRACVPYDYRKESLAVYKRLRRRDARGSYRLDGNDNGCINDNNDMSGNGCISNGNNNNSNGCTGNTNSNDDNTIDNDNDNSNDNINNDNMNDNTIDNTTIDNTNDNTNDTITDAIDNTINDTNDNTNNDSNDTINDSTNDNTNNDSNDNITDTVTDSTGDKKHKMAYYSGIYRNKQRICDSIGRIRANIGRMERYYLKMKDPEGYLDGLKRRFFKLRMEIRERRNMRRRLKDKRSRESGILSRLSVNADVDVALSREEEQLVRRIEEINGVDDTEYLSLLGEIVEMDRSFDYIDHTTVEVMNGDHMDMPLVNTECMRVGEALFSPSIMNCTMPGLSEMIEHAFQSIDRGSTVNVFVTGGFSQIDGFFERVRKECMMNAYGNVRFSMASDAVLDSYYGACFCEYFPIITRDVYAEHGINRIYP